MQDFVKYFRDSSPYINAHRGKTFVLALSGEAIAHPNFVHIVHDIALLHSLGIRLVLVHGARLQIDARLAQANIASSMSGNKRVTSAEAMDCVREAVGGTRIHIEAQLSTGLANSPMAGAQIRVLGGNLVTAKPIGVIDGVDFQHTGEVRRVDRKGVEQILNQGIVALISPIGYSPTGESFNLSFEDVAKSVATEISAEKLMIFNENGGICDENRDLIKLLALSEIPPLLGTDSLSNTDQQITKACLAACKGGVKRAHVIGYRENGALLRELFTHEGSGTLIMENGSEIVRTSAIEDVGGLLELIAPLEEQGTLVKRSRELLEMEITQFTVIETPDKRLVGCAALYPFEGTGSAELACVAVHPDFQGYGFAKRLLSSIEAKSRQTGINELFVLTTQASHWFKEQGFVGSTVEELPIAKKSCYNYQRNSTVLKKRI
ncbi:MAG: amino-acid N-acetyltransferase [bacterium]